jgi:alkylation response protein AidB-like acyl-CoA dehydrogenase
MPEEYGGGGAGTVEELIMMEEFSKVNPNIGVPFLLEGSVVASLIAGWGTPEQKETYLTAMLAAEGVMSIGVTEPNAGSDVANVSTTARRQTDGSWVIDGEKCFITMGIYADWVLTLARVEGEKGIDALRFFIVDTADPGFEVKKMDMWANRPAPTTQMYFRGVRVAPENELDAGFREVMAAFNKERLMVAARWLGHAQHAFDEALAYAQSREQFGKPIGTFQSIGFKLAEAKVDIEAARWLTYRAAWKWDQGATPKEIALDASIAKLHTTKMVERVTLLALHIGGGWGLVKGVLPFAQLAVDAFIAPVTVGSFEIQQRIIARQLGLRVD